jgi:uncharacterized protein YbcI
MNIAGMVGARSLVMAYSKGQVEDEITKKIIQWERDYLGRGPTEAKTDIIRNMAIVTLQGILSPAERILSREKKGMALIKKLRQQLVEQGRAKLEEIITGITSVKVVSLHTDISTKTGERILVFVMERDIDFLNDEKTKKT